MNPDTPGTIQRPTEPDDQQIASLVRAAAETWRLPPQRLDQPTWRDRIGRGARRSRSRWARLAGPLTAAVVGSVMIAFVAVWLTAPRTDRATAGSSASPRASAHPSAAGLPTLFRAGDLPGPARLMVRSGDTYRIADLATGTVGPDAALSGSGPTTVLARPGGGWLCICSDWSLGSSAGRPDGLDIEIETVDSTGVAGPRTAIRSIGGTSDPAFLASAQPELVDVAAIGSTDGRFAFVGWSARQGGAGWQAGIDVVDLSSATVVGSTSFVLPATSNGRPETRVAPRVSLAPSGETLLVSSFWYVEDPSPIPPSGTDHWTAPFDGRTIGPMRSAGSSAGTSCGESASGIVDASRYWVVCSVGDTSLTIERRTADGETVDRTAFPRTAGGMDPGAMLLRQGDGLFFWDPFAARLTRFDLQSGALSGATGTADVPATSPLDALGAVGRQLGRWMAPPAAAKVLLEPAIVASPDGTRIYAIGIDSPTGDGAGGSSGIYAFDARSVSSIGHWPPTADFISLAIGADGRFVYAIGQPGVDARGTTSGADASITVFDTADGSVNLIAGRLGGESLLFPGAIVR